MAMTGQLVDHSAQLIHIIRYASHGGTAKRVEPDVFWFKRPKLLLHPIKMVSSHCLISA